MQAFDSECPNGKLTLYMRELDAVCQVSQAAILIDIRPSGDVSKRITEYHADFLPLVR